MERLVPFGLEYPNNFCRESPRTADLLVSFRDVALPKLGDPHETKPLGDALLEIARLVLLS